MNKNLSALELTQALVRFDTINPPGNERLCAEHLGSILNDAGFAVSYHEFAETRTSLVARIGGDADAKPLCFTGHIDTVPLGAAPWSVDPFAADIADGKLYGRGTSDMKSGVAAFVVAAIRLARELETGPGMVLIITAGEETGCEGAYHLAGLGNVLGDAGAIVVAEPSSNLPFIGHKGALWLKAVASEVPRRNAQVQIWVCGRDGHGAGVQSLPVPVVVIDLRPDPKKGRLRVLVHMGHAQGDPTGGTPGWFKADLARLRAVFGGDDVAVSITLCCDTIHAYQLARRIVAVVWNRLPAIIGIVYMGAIHLNRPRVSGVFGPSACQKNKGKNDGNGGAHMESLPTQPGPVV